MEEKAAKTCGGTETMAFSSNNDIEAALSIKRTFLNFLHRHDIESCYIIVSVNARSLITTFDQRMYWNEIVVQCSSVTLRLNNVQIT